MIFDVKIGDMVLNTLRQCWLIMTLVAIGEIGNTRLVLEQILVKTATLILSSRPMTMIQKVTMLDYGCLPCKRLVRIWSIVHSEWVWVIKNVLGVFLVKIIRKLLWKPSLSGSQTRVIRWTSLLPIRPTREGISSDLIVKIYLIIIFQIKKCLYDFKVQLFLIWDTQRLKLIKKSVIRIKNCEI